jgi:hypothetical protein
MENFRRGLISIFICMLFTVGGQPTLAQGERAIYFPETDHWVRGEFLTYYESLSDPEALLGNPITDSFSDLNTGRKIQYFQNARLVLDPNAPPELRVKQTPLGQELYEPGVSPSFPPNSSDCRQYSLNPEQSYRVCYAFLDFFDAHGGLVQFGYPISDFEIQGNRIVQYFQNARFEWHPELVLEKHVSLGHLGMEYFRESGEDPRRLRPSLENNAIRTILSLQVNAFVSQAVTPFSGQQTLFVIVQDQNHQPISNAEVSFSLEMPSGRSEQFYADPTDEFGVTSETFNIDAQTYGLAKISILVQYGELETNSRASFRIWW